MVKLCNTCKDKYFKRGVKLCHHDNIRLFIIKQKSRLETPDSVQHIESPYLFQGSARPLKAYSAFPTITFAL